MLGITDAKNPVCFLYLWGRLSEASANSLHRKRGVWFGHQQDVWFTSVIELPRQRCCKQGDVTWRCKYRDRAQMLSLIDI